MSEDTRHLSKNIFELFYSRSDLLEIFWFKFLWFCRGGVSKFLQFFYKIGLSREKIFHENDGKEMVSNFYNLSLHKCKPYGKHKACEGCNMVPMEGFAAKNDDGKEGEHNEGDDFLNYLQLH